jgi:hypothetical protein
LNVERKQYDEKFERDTGIGEEVDEPDAMEFNPDLINASSDYQDNSRSGSMVKQVDVVKPQSSSINDDITTPLIQEESKEDHDR